LLFLEKYLEGIIPVPYVCTMFNTKKNKMKNQNKKINGHGVEVQVTEAGAVFIEINGITVYFENGDLGPILDAWKTRSTNGNEISFTDQLNNFLQA